MRLECTTSGLKVLGMQDIWSEGAWNAGHAAPEAADAPQTAGGTARHGPGTVTLEPWP